MTQSDINKDNEWIVVILMRTEIRVSAWYNEYELLTRFYVNMCPFYFLLMRPGNSLARNNVVKWKVYKK